ncbi:MAG: hypothetical protein K8W52_17865 [Deltaproteobacteria bacterium]|nr:hypothetical protein [Deltaproteobacteria bacterium]
MAIGDELVLDAIGDTFTGDVTWDPSRVSLTQHVRGVIAARVRHEIARQAKLPHLPMTGDLDSGDGLDMVAVAASRVVAADEDAPPERIAMRASAASAMDALRRMALGDADVIAILDAFEAECYSREEIRCQAPPIPDPRTTVKVTPSPAFSGWAWPSRGGRPASWREGGSCHPG